MRSTDISPSRSSRARKAAQAARRHHPSPSHEDRVATETMAPRSIFVPRALITKPGRQYEAPPKPPGRRYQPVGPEPKPKKGAKRTYTPYERALGRPLGIDIKHQTPTQIAGVTEHGPTRAQRKRTLHEQAQAAARARSHVGAAQPLRPRADWHPRESDFVGDVGYAGRRLGGFAERTARQRYGEIIHPDPGLELHRARVGTEAVTGIDPADPLKHGPYMLALNAGLVLLPGTGKAISVGTKLGARTLERTLGSEAARRVIASRAARTAGRVATEETGAVGLPGRVPGKPLENVTRKTLREAALPEHLGPVDLTRGKVSPKLHKAVRESINETDLSVFREHGIDPKVLARAVERGEPGRHWYRDSGKMLLRLAGGDKKLADRFAQLVSVYSASRKPIENMQLAVNAIREWKATGRISTVGLAGTGDQIEKANLIMAGKGFKGMKTDRFYKNHLKHIDEAKYKREFGKGESTHDIWMARLFGLKSDNPTPREYAAMEGMLQRLAKKTGWQPEELQAAMWISKKAESEGTSIAEAGLSYADALRHESAVLPFEAAPGRESAPHLYELFSKLSPARQRTYTRQKAQLLNGYFRETGILGHLGSEGPGVFEGQISPGWSAYVAASRGTGPEMALQVSEHSRSALDHVAAAVGEAFHQDAAAWFKPFYRTNVNVGDANGMLLTIGRTVEPGEAQALDGAFRAAGHDIAIVHSPEGVYLLNFSKLPNPEFQRFVVQSLDQVMPGTGKLGRFAFDGNYIERGDYALHLRGSTAGPPDLLDRAFVRLQERSAAVDARHFGGGAAAARAPRASGARAALTRLVGEERGAVAPEAIAGVSRRGPAERVIRQGDYEQVVPGSSPSYFGEQMERVTDYVSTMLEGSDWARKTKFVRKGATGQRVTKYAGRQHAWEKGFRMAEMQPQIDKLRKLKNPVKEAHFWYAQLPRAYRDANGLRLVRGYVNQHLERVVSGAYVKELENGILARRAQIKEMGSDGFFSPEANKLKTEIEEFKNLVKDAPRQAEDAGAQIKQLDKLIAKPPAYREDVVDSLRVLMNDRERTFVEGARLDPERAAERKGLLSRTLGLEPDGTEVYMGHRLPRAGGMELRLSPSTGLGRVRSPQGVGTTNRMLLARSGRLRATTDVALEDWMSAQAFEDANTARNTLHAMGDEFRGTVAPNQMLINRKGQTIPANMRTAEFSQFAEHPGQGPGWENITDELRAEAKGIIDGFFADGSDRAAWEAMAQASGDWGDLRVIDKDLAENYFRRYSLRQGRRSKGFQAWDAAVDWAALSIITGRVGYIPKNIAQNLIASVPHQGAFLFRNLARSAQVLADPELRHFAQQAVGHSGAARELARETTRFGKVSGIPGKVGEKSGQIADDPYRIAAFLHEAARDGIISKGQGLLGEADKRALLRAFKDESPAGRRRLYNVSQRGVEPMLDFSRMTPDQTRNMRRIAIIPSYLVAGTRYPFMFAKNYPLRSALMIYIGAGEPGAPDRIPVNKPIDEYLAKGASFLKGIPVGGKVLRTGAISPVSLPEDVARAAVQTIKGKSAFDTDPSKQTAWDFASVPVSVISDLAQQGLGVQGLDTASRRLFPSVRMVVDVARGGKESKFYPEDTTVGGRLKRELGVVPIKVDAGAGKTTGDRVQSLQADSKKYMHREAPPEIVDEYHAKLDLEKKNGRGPGEDAPPAEQLKHSQKRLRNLAGELDEKFKTKRFSIAAKRVRSFNAAEEIYGDWEQILSPAYDAWQEGLSSAKRARVEAQTR